MLDKFIEQMKVSDKEQIRLSHILNNDYLTCKYYTTHKCLECGYKEILIKLENDLKKDK